MKKLTKYILFVSLGGLFAVNIFNSLINTEKINLFFGGTVNNNIIHIHSTDYTSPVAVPRASNDIPPVITQTASRDSIPAVIPQVSEDTHKAETLSKDSRPQTNTYRPELIYQFISRYLGLISAGENDKSAKVSEDAKTVTPDIQPAKPQKVSHDTPAINVSADEPATPQSPDIPAETPRNDSAPKTITFTSWLKTRSSKDTHTFTLDDSCAVNVSFTPSEGDKAYYVLTVTGDFGHVITRKMIDSENLHTGTGNIYLRPGNYTVSIERGYSWSGKPYRITVNTSQPAITEHESNNSPQTANVIPLNEDVRASSGTRNDTDYFTFTLEKPCMVCPHLEFHAVRNGRQEYTLKLYKLEFLGIDIEPFVFRGDAKTSREIKPFVLDAGTYIMSISRLDSEELELGLHEYTLRVDAQEIM